MITSQYSGNELLVIPFFFSGELYAGLKKKAEVEPLTDVSQQQVGYTSLQTFQFLLGYNVVVPKKAERTLPDVPKNGEGDYSS